MIDDDIVFKNGFNGEVIDTIDKFLNQLIDSIERAKVERGL